MKILLSLLFAISLFAQVAIDFRGNRTFTKEQLYEALGLERPWWKRLFDKEPPKVDEKLLPILHEELRAFYREQGFWDAVIELERNESVAIFAITENEPIKVADLSITSDFPIRRLIPLKKGERFVASKFVSSKEAITQALLEAGYCSYEFDPKAYVLHRQKEAYLVYYLQKNSPCSIGSVNVGGLETVDERVVLTHIYLRPGDPFTLERVRQSYYRLHSLEYFRFVNIDYSKKIHNKILLDITLKERRHRNVYKVGLGYDTQNGIHTSFYYKHLNYHMFQPSIHLFYSNIKKGGELSIFYPSLGWFGSLYPDSVTSVGYTQSVYDGFSERSYHIGLKLLKEYHAFSGSLKLNFERTKIYDAQDCIAERTYTLAYPELTLLWDRRDSKISPRKGFYLQDRFSLSVLSHQFVKNEARGGLYIPLGPESLLFAKALFGTITADDMPPGKLFYAGGVTSNRAYTYRQLTALDSDCDIGGRTILETTLEPRYRYSDRLWLALFWDRTYLSHEQMHIGPYRDGVGIGVLYDTPVGELKLYFGLDPQDLGQNAINLYLGATF